MARYERDYGRDFGRRRQPGPPPYGGMRSDGWGSSGEWQNFPGEEGWYGEGYEGMPNDFTDTGPRGAEWESRWRRQGGGLGGQYRGYGSDFRGGYGADYRSRQGPYGARGWDSGYGGRDLGYSEGWQDQWSGSRDRGRSLEMSRNVSRTRAADVMTENPHSVTPETSITDVAKKMRDLNVGIIPVIDSTEDRHLRGVITDRDIAIRAVAEGKDGKVKVSDCMTSDIRAVNKNDSIHDVMRAMRNEQIRRVPVTDREGRLVGIIAQADLAVDYAGDDPQRETQVGELVERISEPAQPGRGASRMAASGRSGEMSAPSKGSSSSQEGQRSKSRGTQGG